MVSNKWPLPPLPWPAKKVCFSNFFEENSIFIGVLGEKACFRPPGKKSADVKALRKANFSKFWAYIKLETCFFRIAYSVFSVSVQNRIFGISLN